MAIVFLRTACEKGSQDTGKLPIVHILFHGFTICDMSDKYRFPGEWPHPHKWCSIGDFFEIPPEYRCKECDRLSDEFCKTLVSLRNQCSEL